MSDHFVGHIYVRVEDDETYDDAWNQLNLHGPSVAVTSYDDLENGEKAYLFEILARYQPPPPEPEMTVEVPLGVEAADDRLRGSREDLLLLARTIYDILEGES